MNGETFKVGLHQKDAVERAAGAQDHAMPCLSVFRQYLKIAASSFVIPFCLIYNDARVKSHRPRCAEHVTIRIASL